MLTKHHCSSKCTLFIGILFLGTKRGVVQVEEKNHVQFKQIFTNNLFLQVSISFFLLLLFFGLVSGFLYINVKVKHTNVTSANSMQLHILTDFLYFKNHNSTWFLLTWK